MVCVSPRASREILRFAQDDTKQDTEIRSDDEPCHSERSEESRIFLDACRRTPNHSATATPAGRCDALRSHSVKRRKTQLDAGRERIRDSSLRSRMTQKCGRLLVSL